MKKIISLLCIGTMVLGASGCGTILYPERNGQNRDGNLDLGVVLLDGIGLFFFIIPGVIAYAVDFNNGTIYLPHKGVTINLSVENFDKKNMDEVYVGKENITSEKIREVVSENVGHDVDTQSALAYKIESNS